MSSPLMQPAKLPFLFHIAIETAAACSFILKPDSQLTNPPVAVQLVLQQFGGLLLTTNLICLIFVSRPFDETSRQVAAALAFWHVWPCWRAYVRLKRPEVDDLGKQKGKQKGEVKATRRTLGGPAVHLAVHVGMFLMFAKTVFM
ncbi:hypothetical protein BDP55DRAFT_148676 [Colletotrichum godetiae]|uniref:Uncharacterized protein n=1 Tax=Colletotrichum godetiae TaxID=1209918 RepID=A0AAJ0AKT9_9PEZI|nr:uncharacterized protein BDP55DRAFT_148676 [Colletotrichum godetiae]KAK1675738.1 hypothetical protein BDP55DRAFT_148676 [Colletotrichum godetiae]